MDEGRIYLQSTQSNANANPRPYKRQFTGTRHSIPVRHAAEAVAPVQPVRSKKAAWVMLSLCLMLAILAVLFVPLLVGGETSVAAAVRTTGAADAALVETVSYSSVEEAQQALGMEAHLPAVFTSDVATISSVQVLDGRILEVQYTVDRALIVFRTAQGNEDISGNTKEYAFSAIEEVGGITRSYSGATEKVFSIATWAADGHTYAISVESGLEADTMRTIAESVY